MTETGSTVPRRQVGRLLRQLREQAGVSLMAAAHELEFSRARMYRIENGEVPVRKHDVIAMCGVYAAPGHMTEVLIGLAAESKAKGWWHAYGDVVPAWFELYVGMEQAASRLRSFAPGVIPGLLQTREYAEAVFRKWHGDDEEAVANAVAVRLERQSLLSRRLPEAPRLDVAIDEGVLRRAIPDTLGMQKQLAHLVNVSTRTNISVRVIPFAAGPHQASSSGQFTVLEFPAVGTASPEPSTIYCENLTGALYLDKLAEVAAYESIWAEIDAIALNRADSDDLIRTIIEESDG
ncbi:helix-turn-helix domain-containing protein [Actinoplanes derwentensis]|uniref:Helix-turn-helix domain-containing protein n=1 Tax=Actinoplanes derwentensis TaxID=113562 RepID=A0A1H2DAW9_9ACTN|nr:helix-turn-helix transcriptional regulator [Actinoplanes derwentensis]GID81788.1 transcriptional regulator [Actinoplanes derwentensis]SDT79851.1 Helix-turn-helix domain-containing protein [Actinoplanes derwentensis]